MALWACPPRQSPWEECRLFWKDTTLCARTSTEQSRWAPVGRDCQVLLYSRFSSLSGKESAQGCLPKHLLGRPDEALGGGNHL